MPKILFIGNFLSRSKGTINPSEKLAVQLSKLGFRTQCASHHKNIILRFFHILWASATYSYDIIHIDVFSGKALWFVLVAAKIAAVRSKTIILGLHGGKLAEVYPLKKRYLHFAFRHASRIISPSLFLTKFFSQKGFPVEYIPNSIDLSLFSFRWKSEQLQEKKILWVRAFAAIYRPHLALKIFSNVVKKFPEATLTMIGPNHGLLDDVKKEANALGIADNVSFVGVVQNKDLPDYLSSHSVLLNTTQYESFGMGVLEAASTGLPVVSSSVGELPYLWRHEHSILLSEDDSANSYASLIQRLFEDRHLAESISKNAKGVANSFDWNQVQKRWIDLLEKI